MNDPKRPPPAGKQEQRLILRFLPIAVILAALGAFLLLGLDRYVTFESLQDNRKLLTDWVAESPRIAMTAFLVAYAAAATISFPGSSILTIFGGFLFGLWPGVPLVVAAATVGGTIVFLSAKSALANGLSRRAGGFVSRMEQGFRENELNYLFFLRLAPVFPFWAVNIAAGVLGVRLGNFLIGTFFGIIPGTFVYASIGNAASAAFDAGENVTLRGMVFKFEVLLPLIGLAALALLVVLLRPGRKGSR